MSIDVTDILIQRIIGQLAAGDASVQQTKSDLITNLDSAIGTAANYAQILTTVSLIPSAEAVAFAAATEATKATATAAIVAAAANPPPIKIPQHNKRILLIAKPIWVLTAI